MEKGFTRDKIGLSLVRHSMVNSPVIVQ